MCVSILLVAVLVVVEPWRSRGHEMFHDDMIMYAIINDQQSVKFLEISFIHARIPIGS